MIVQPTMVWGLAGPVHLVVHGTDLPSDDEWHLYLAALEQHAMSLRGVLAFVPHGTSLTRAQRRALTEQWQHHGTTPRMAIMTSSLVTRGIVSSIGWVLGTNVRAFGITDFQGAADHLHLDADELALVRAEIAAMSAALVAA